MVWLLAFSLVLAGWGFWTGNSFLSNLKIARRTGLPIVISPVFIFNPLWVLFHKNLISLLKSLPWGLGNFTRYNKLGWTYDDKYRIHEELGDAFIVVNPSQNDLYVAEAGAIDAITARRKDFTKPAAMYSEFNVPDNATMIDPI